MEEAKKRRLGALLFPGFELLDVFGPLEMFGMVAKLDGSIEIVLVAQDKGPVASNQGPRAIADHGFDDCPHLDLVLVPGGFGTRAEVENPALLDFVRRTVATAEIAMSVCTGSALLARAGVLDGRRATTNKMFFSWAAAQGPAVEWVKEARWVEDGKLVTSSGVSAGMDMALAVIARLHGASISDNVALAAEYDWHRDSSWDPFARHHGLV